MSLPGSTKEYSPKAPDRRGEAWPLLQGAQLPEVGLRKCQELISVAPQDEATVTGHQVLG